jgi:transposase
VIAFNNQGPEGLIDVPQPGRPPKLSWKQKQEVAEIVKQGPDSDTDGIVRWRCSDLQQLIRHRYGVRLDEDSVRRILKEMGLSHISARPRHPRQWQAPEQIERFKKKSSPRRSPT